MEKTITLRQMKAYSFYIVFSPCYYHKKKRIRAFIIQPSPQGSFIHKTIIFVTVKLTMLINVLLVDFTINS